MHTCNIDARSVLCSHAHKGFACCSSADSQILEIHLRVHGAARSSTKLNRRAVLRLDVSTKKTQEI